MTIQELLSRKVEILLEKHVTTFTIGFFRGIKQKGGLGLFWQILPQNKEQEFLSSIDLTGKTVYDIGGYIGLMASFFARSVGETGFIVTFEPNPHNFNKLKENIQINGFSNIRMFNMALGKQEGASILRFTTSHPAQGSVCETAVNGLKELDFKSINVPINSLDNLISDCNLPTPDVIKIDVEGFELDVLKGMPMTLQKNQPILYIEIHGYDLAEKLKKAKNVTSLLSSFDYSVYHVESSSKVNTENYAIASEGHIFAWVSKKKGNKNNNK